VVKAIRGWLFLFALALTGCTAGQAERAPSPVAEPGPSANAEEARAVSGLRLPVEGEIFSIGDEQWKVEATTLAFPTDHVQEDTQLIDVTVQARRVTTAPVEYLGQEKKPDVP
jgi:hypothetical protein